MSRTRKLTANQDSLISKRYTDGMTQRKLAVDFNVGTHCIETSLRRTQTKGRKHGYLAINPVDFSLKERIIDEYLICKSLTKLSEKYGSKTQLRNLLANAGVLQNKNSKIAVDHCIILKLFNDGLTIQAISKQTGFSSWSIGKSLKEQNVDTLARRKNETVPFKIYLRAVRKFTNRSWKSHHDSINPTGEKRGRLEYHIDHRYSISEGFRNAIPPYIIGHWTNLQMLLYTQNVSKFTKCHKSKLHLFEEFDQAQMSDGVSSSPMINQ